MKFKVGDVCEIISVCSRKSSTLGMGGARGRDFIGRECTVLSTLVFGKAINCAEPFSGYRCEVNGLQSDFPGGSWFLEPSQLKLKRPPSWNEWLTDTREVEREQVPA